MAESLRVLVADEDRHQLEPVSEALEKLGHEVIALAVEAGESARATHEHCPDLAIVALHEDKEHALELIEQIVDEATCPVCLLAKQPSREFLSKAARLLQGDHRLALSGTPIENHLGELWSLFEFLNPGMLGAASVFQMAQGVSRNPDENTRRLLAQALRPFVLRRTKEQVARDLPLALQ